MKRHQATLKSFGWKVTVGGIVSFLFITVMLALLETWRRQHAWDLAWGVQPNEENILFRAFMINAIQLSLLFTRYFFRGLDVITDHVRMKLYVCFVYLLVLSWVALILKYFNGPRVDIAAQIVGLLGIAGIIITVYFFLAIIKVYQNIEARLLREQELSEKYYQQLITDSLTGLPNRLLFEEDLTKSLAAAERQGGQLAVLFFDLDRFKIINDTLGHTCGDLLLQAVTDRLQANFTQGEQLYRLGGDEFIIVLESISDVQTAIDLSQCILQLFEHPFLLEGQELYISTSIGIAAFPEDGQDTATLFKNADLAMYLAKERGRNTYQRFVSAMNARAQERMALEQDLRKAIEQEQLVLYYQPKVSIDTGKLVGLEALVRWNHPQRGMVPPGDFIPLAEDTKLILPISNWVLRTACQQMKAWQLAGHPQLKVAVNISPQQFEQAQLVNIVRQVLAETELDPSALELEITEGMMMVNVERAITMMHELAELGVRISVDDFGTGYSSLSYLQKFPIHSLKIDRSFVRDITDDAEDAAIAAAIIAMAHSLRLHVVAEGVETEAQLQFLREHRCDEMQGFYISRPVPAEELADRFLRKLDRAEKQVL